MRIIQFIYTLGSGGGEKFVVDLSNELSRLGHEVHLITVSEEEERYKFNKQFLNGDVTYHCLHCSVKLNLSTIPKLERLIEEITPDVVNSHLNILYLYRLSLRRKDIKFFYTLHSVANVCIGKGIFRWLAKYFFKKGYINTKSESRQGSDFSHASSFLIYNHPSHIYDKHSTDCKGHCRKYLLGIHLAKESESIAVRLNMLHDKASDDRRKETGKSSD